MGYCAAVGGDPIYVEIVIGAPMESLWAATQEPSQHQRWDLRFTQIEYLDRQAPGASQEFLYTTRMGFGITISGEGETSATASKSDGSRVSALRFRSDNPMSLIEEGSGYWKYTPVDGGVRFVTQYDYKVRWGTLGEAVDRLLFRRLLGWATAWSFDRLRMWLEDGVPPEVTIRSAIAHHISRTALALCWLYQGAIPKLLVADSGELELAAASGIPLGQTRPVVIASGLAEIGAGLACLTWRRAKWPLVATLLALPVLGAAAARAQPRLFGRAFNPGSLTIAMAGLAMTALATMRQVPSSSNTVRRAPRDR